MMTKTQQDALADGLLKQVNQAAMDAALSGEANAIGDRGKAKPDQRKAAVSPRSGAVLPPGKGRPPGVRNKLTNLRDAVLEAFDRVGGADYLVRLAEGTQSDRAAFTGLVAKVLPTQINQNVEGGVRLELSWLGGRNIGTTTLENPEKRTQVLDLQRDDKGMYRINDPDTPVEGVAPTAGDAPEAAGDAQGRGA